MEKRLKKAPTYYRTRDLYEASFLYASELKLYKTEKIDSVTLFVFEDQNKAEKLTGNYYNKTATVNAKAYADAIRTLKDLIFGRG